jgi:hypothetical protein
MTNHGRIGTNGTTFRKFSHTPARKEKFRNSVPSLPFLPLTTPLGIDLGNVEDFARRLLAAVARIKRIGHSHWIRDVEHDRDLGRLDDLDEQVVAFIEREQR